MSFASAADAQDAIDNMDLNELKGRVLKVNLARQVKAPVQGAGNRASTLPRILRARLNGSSGLTAVWESEEWLKHYAKPLGRSGGEYSWFPSVPQPIVMRQVQVLHCVPKYAKALRA